MPDPRQAAELLASKAIEAGIERFVDRDELEELKARAEFAGSKVTDQEAESVLRELCHGKRSFAELQREDFLCVLRTRLPHQLDRIAPAKLQLSGGRWTKVHYATGQPPWVSSRLQDFFGMKETPRINGVPVVAHLLAPSQRPVQTTSDLAGFWERLYPQVRRELSRRYPKHKWPEKPV
jgi:ATP-dependent helicase HrpB